MSADIINKIKILMVLGNTRMGGVQALILNILRNIDLNKFHIDFAINFYAESNGIEDECRKYGCKFYILPYFKIYNYMSYKRNWTKFLKQHNYDIVYAHSTNSASIFLKIAKRLEMKTISHSHSAGFRGGIIERMAKKYFARGVGEVSDYWFACSDKAAIRLYGKDYANYKHYYAIPNAIDAAKYLFNNDIRTRIRKQYGIGDETMLYGHVGTFSTPKNHKFLIEIFENILKLHPNSALICCGAGALQPAIANMAKENNISDKVIFAGVVNNVNEIMMGMDAFIFPSLFEGFPVSILEAQAAGLSITMSDVITTEVDLTNLVHRCNLEETAETWASRIINNSTPTNRSYYNDIVANSEYNIKKTVKKFEKLYEELVKSK